MANLKPPHQIVVHHDSEDYAPEDGDGDWSLRSGGGASASHHSSTGRGAGGSRPGSSALGGGAAAAGTGTGTTFRSSLRGSSVNSGAASRGGSGGRGIGPATPASEETYEHGIIYESDASRIYRVSGGEIIGASTDGAAAAEGSAGAVVVKALVSPNPSRGAISDLYNEFNILTQHLSACSSARGAIRQGSFGGSHHAIHLHCVDGCTLREWTGANPVPSPAPQRVSGGMALSTASGTGPRTLRRRRVTPLWAARGLPRYVRTMRAVARALADVHEAGVGHGNVSLDNVIITETNREAGSSELGGVIPNAAAESERADSSAEDGKRQEDIHATLIDFGRAFSLNEAEGTEEDGESHLPSPRLRRDLRMMGKVFLEMLHGEADCGDSEVAGSDASASFQSAIAGTAAMATISDLYRSFVPEPILAIVSQLLDPKAARVNDKEQGGLISARNVEQQLENVILSLNASSLGIKNYRSPFDFDDHLFGRDQELSEILSAYERIRSPPLSQSLSPPMSEIVLLEGVSGTGKSALARQIQAPVVADSGLFVSGKFDQLCHAEPYAALSAAFIELCDLILAMDDSVIREVRESILRNLGPSWRILSYIIPNIRQIVMTSESLADSSSGTEAAINISTDNFHFIFVMFLKAVCRADRPLVLFVDDMQWADAPSLSLLKVLLIDPEIASRRSFMFMGSYRSNEVHDEDTLAVQLRDIESCGVIFTRVEVRDLTPEVVCELISSALDMPQDACLSFADNVYQKTNGNAYYTIEILRSLCAEGVVRFSIDTLAWEWDEDDIRTRDIANNVVGLLSRKILKLPESVQAVMKLASCIGAQFDGQMLHLVTKSTKDQPWTGELGMIQSMNLVSDALQAIVDEGLMFKLTSGRFKFAHDRVSEAAYSLIPPDDRSLWHYGIGSSIRQCASPKELEKIVFAVVDQMNRGAEMAVGAADQIDLARLNLRAGKRAMTSSAYMSATSYLRAGIDLLRQGDEKYWENEYDISLGLHNAYATSAYCNGNFDQMEEIIEQDILRHANSLFDKTTGFLLIIKALGARDKLQEAIIKGFGILAELGEPFPDAVSQKILVLELMKTKLVLRGKNNASIVSLPPMTDKSKIAAMEVLGCIFAFVYMARADMLPILTFRMVRLSVKFGVSGVSAYAFALYGLICCGGLGDLDGLRFGNCALSLLERSKTSEWCAKVYLVVHALLNHWKEPLKASLQSQIEGYEKGMKAGDVETAMMVIHGHCAFHFHCQFPLGPTEALFRKYHRVMTDHSQDVVLGIHLLFWQASLNLMGRTENPVELTGEVLDQDLMAKDSLLKGKSMELCFLNYHRMVLAYTFGEYLLAAEMGQRSRSIGIFALSNFVVSQHKFYEGLNAAVLYRQTGKRKWRQLARANKKMLKKWDRLSSGNRFHMVLLLKADLSSPKLQMEKAKALYDSAILEAGKAGFIFDKGVANERAAAFFSNRDDGRGTRYLSRALACYVEYGAQAKVNQLVSQFPHLQGQDI